MTKKHFVAIAEIIKVCRLVRRPCTLAIDELALELANYFEFINPEFKKNRFLDACGMEIKK